MENLDNRRLKDELLAGFWKVVVENTDSSTTVRPDEFRRMFDSYYDNMPEELKNAFNDLDMRGLFEHCTVTMEVTTKKKGKVLTADSYHQHLVGKIFNISDKYQEHLHYKQLIYGYFDITCDTLTHIRNAKPAKICCNALSHQFRYCDQHGMGCEENVVTYNVNTATNKRQYLMTSKSGDCYHMKHCPYCGEKLIVENNQN